MNGILEAYEKLGVSLKKMGQYWKGPCPFHKENDPSFTVYPDGGYYCFGCRAYGRLEDLYSEREKESLFLSNNLDLDGGSVPKNLVDLSKIIRRMGSECLRACDGSVEECAKIYKASFLSERIVLLTASKRNQLGVLSKIRRLFGSLRSDKTSEVGG